MSTDAIGQPLAADELKDFDSDPRAWLARQAKQRTLEYLLAHADDALIWGRYTGEQLVLATVEDGKLVTADANGMFDGKSTLDTLTLQQVRLFGPAGELFVWRVDNGFAARSITKADEANADALDDEWYWLWGWRRDAADEQNGFTLLTEGAQGLRHAVPLVGLANGQRVALVVRHYLDYDDDSGEARIALSRLVKIESIKMGGTQ
jgi:CRISPR-associated protein (TIGR03984 family)